MVRSAAKNFESVAVVTDPADYDRVAKELESAAKLSLATRLELARKAFAHNGALRRHDRHGTRAPVGCAAGMSN